MWQLCWSCTLLFSCVFILIIMRKTKVNILWLFCLIGVLCGIILAITNIIVQKYDAYCSMFLGILCSCYNYYDNKRNPVSKMTNAYISSLQGYVAGLGLLLYGIMSLWH